MKTLIILFIKFYQISFGRLMPRVCRFEPSCSQYALEAVSKLGLIRGIALSLWRILRCNPFFKGGWDPVPDRSALIKAKVQIE